MKRLRYKEGDVFAVTLDGGGFSLGVVARMPKGGKVLLGYFFGPCLSNIPAENELPDLRPELAVRIAMFGDLFLRNGKWPVVSSIPNWDRRRWPMPKFIRRDDITHTARLVTYSEDNPNCQIAEERCDFETTGYEKDSVWGAGFTELFLAKRLRQE